MPVKRHMHKALGCAAFAAVVGIYAFGEEPDIRRLVCIGLILIGIVGLKLSSSP